MPPSESPDALQPEALDMEDEHRDPDEERHVDSPGRDAVHASPGPADRSLGTESSAFDPDVDLPVD